MPHARPFFFNVPRSFAAPLLAAAVATMAGCGSGLEEFPVAPATGVVLCGGDPISSGRVQFSPKQPDPDAIEAGKPARGVIGPDGTFTLSTYERGDGAVVGVHSVAVWPDGLEGEGGRGDTSGVMDGCPDGRVDGVFTVTAEGPNEFTIELDPAG